MFGFNPNKINPPKVEKAEDQKTDPQRLFALAKVEAESVSIRPADRSPEGRLLASPNGMESNLSEEYWKLVRTPSFKKWFGDSDIIDENGEPALVFHSTNDNIDDFVGFSIEAAREKRREKDLFKGTTQALGEIEDSFYFTAGNRKYGKNRLSVFLNVKSKKMNNQSEMIWKEKGSFDKLKKQGFTGIVLYFNDVQNEIDTMKKEFRRTYAPKDVMDKVFFGFKKIMDFENQIHGLLNKEKSERLKDVGRDAIKRIKLDQKRFNENKSEAKTKFFEVCVFDPIQIMIVDKEKSSISPEIT